MFSSDESEISSALYELFHDAQPSDNPGRIDGITPLTAPFSPSPYRNQAVKKKISKATQPALVGLPLSALHPGVVNLTPF